MEGIALITKNANDRIALRGVKLTSRIEGLTQRTTIEQNFVNLENHAIEAVYTFPLPEEAAVCHLEVITGSRIWTGQVQDRELAIQKYEDAIDEGHGAFLAEQERPNVFTIRVGNLKPQQAATIRLTYVAQLHVVDRTLRLCFPTTVAPRYAATTATDALEAALANEVLNPPHVCQTPYGLTMELDLDLSMAVERIESPSHGLATETLPEGKYRIRLAQAPAPMDRDIVVSVALKNEQQPAARVTRGSKGEHYVGINFLPEFDVSDAAPSSVDVLFVLDCSGSMEGDSISQARRALELCLRSMNAGDRFNICRFGSRWELMRPEPRIYNEATLQAALRYVEHIQADLGGTELFPALEALFKMPPAAGSHRQVILLTDGQISNEAEVIALARQHRATHRIFAFGIGAASSSHLVNGLARATGGVAEFITGNERIDEKVLRTFSRLASPEVTDVALDWSNAAAGITPRELPGLFDGDALEVMARISGPLPESVTLRCQTANGPKSWSLRLPAPSDDAGTLSLGWARRTLCDLEEIDGARAQIRQRRTPSAAHRQALEIALEHNLLCSLTALVAVEHRSVEQRTKGAPVIQRVPIQLAHGWDGTVSTGSAIMDYLMGSAMGPTPPAAAGGANVSRKRRLARGSYECRVLYSSEPAELSDSARMRSEPASAKPQQMSAVPSSSDLLLLQTADGWFTWNKSFDALLKPHAGGSSAPVEHCRKQFATIMQARGKSPDENVLHTILVLFLLERDFAGDESLWRRAADKAYRWLAKQLSTTLDEARKFVREAFASFK